MDKQEFKTNIQSLIDQLETRIDDLGDKIEDIADDVKDEYAGQIERMKKLKDDLVEKLEQYDLLSDSKWDVVKDSAASFMSKVAEAWREDFEKVKDAFSKGEK
ncbi:MAG: hypothetical protein GXZ03_09955 [Proteiniphilum sp.]|nr:hypothetical protein [Proteiniphilum sp.]